MLLSTLGYTVSKGQIKPQQVQYGKPFQKVPDSRDVTIYQVNMRTFSKEGNFKGVIARLDSIKALGANVIYLMPIYPVGVVNSVNSPYCIRDYRAINKEFGNLKDLRTLVEGAHLRNMAVILDWVANHTSFDHVWTNNKSWYQQDSLGNIISPPKTGWSDVAQLDFSNAAMRSAMISAMKYWVLSANVDGFRCDYSDGPPFTFWKQALDTLKAIPEHKLLMLSEGTRTDHFRAGFDYNFGFRFFENMKEVYEHNKSVQSIDSMNVVDYKDTSPANLMVRYTSNHDVNSSDGTPLDLFGGKKGSMAAFVVVSYMKSVPMIYNGQEVGTPYRLTFPFKTTTIDWSVNPDITAEYKRILAFRTHSDAIRRGELTSYSSADVCAFTRQSDSEKVFIISNLRDKSIHFSVPEPLKNTVWKDVFNGSSKGLNTEITLEPYSYLVLKAAR